MDAQSVGNNASAFSIPGGLTECGAPAGMPEIDDAELEAEFEALDDFELESDLSMLDAAVVPEDQPVAQPAVRHAVVQCEASRWRCYPLRCRSVGLATVGGPRAATPLRCCTVQRGAAPREGSASIFCGFFSGSYTCLFSRPAYSPLPVA